MGQGEGVVSPDVETLIEALRATAQGRLLVVTGAGVSLASGIPTYRGTDPGAIWKNELVEMGTFAYFHRDPVGWWKWILGLADTVARAKPNPAHFSLAALEAWQLEQGGRYLLVTQNIDTLHEQAGSKEMVKVHGSADRLRCSRVGCGHGAPRGTLPSEDFDMGPFQAEPCLENLPRCPACDSLLRAHALLFDEYYTEHIDYQFDRVQLEAAAMDLVLFVGTSFSVGITDLILQAALSRRIPLIAIDPGSHAPPPLLRLQAIRAKAEELLPTVCREMGLPVGTAGVKPG